METLKTTKFASLCCLGCLSLLACEFFDGEDAVPNTHGNALSSSEEPLYSSDASSSSFDRPNILQIEWQEAPEESRVHGTTQITLDHFLISKHLVTQSQYKLVMGNNPSKGVINDDLPVEGVRWIDAVEFCKLLSRLYDLNDNAIRLPTEAEWEAASYAASSVIQRNENYWEWTNDCFNSDFPYNGITNNPSGPPNCLQADPRVRKGASSSWDARFSTDPYAEDIAGGYISFRVVVKSKDY
jgi:hypothetical protein